MLRCAGGHLRSFAFGSADECSICLMELTAGQAAGQVSDIIDIAPDLAVYSAFCFVALSPPVGCMQCLAAQDASIFLIDILIGMNTKQVTGMHNILVSSSVTL